MNLKAICFVDMPFGQKADLKSGVVVDFDQIYNDGIKPAIEGCGLEAIRGDQERTGGIIHSAMFARLLLAEFMVADLTLANANVFYELGIRHAARPFTTVPIFANIGALPFDLALVRAVGYQLEDGRLAPAAAEKLKADLAQRLRDAMKGEATNDSPIFQLIPKFPGIDLSEELTETFKDRVRRVEDFRRLLAEALAQPKQRAKCDALLKIQHELGDLHALPRAVPIELLLSFRDAEGFEELIALYEQFPDYMKDYVVARQQYALALNRRNLARDRSRALGIVDELLRARGPDPETLGIAGRIHKDVFKEACEAKKITAAAALDDAIAAYTKGFEADPRDYYPGVNAINLLIRKGDADSLREAERLLPLVSFAVARRGGGESRNYWDLATVLELACIGNDWPMANRVLPKALLAANDAFKTASTLRNLELLKEARVASGVTPPELDAIILELTTRTNELRGG